ncbi:MAG: transglycosylase SLT domain-containing protein [Thermodesulfobacteriota bacterium]|nr:transglycosylase SLT domain-containing protein [Thermodesulfobacteriota bacterium]
MKTKILLILATVLFLAVEGYGASTQPVDLASLVSSVKNMDTLSFCGERVPLEDQDVQERFEKELLLSIWDRPQVILWLKRSRRYLPYIEKMLRENGMPDDFKYLAFAESALRPHAGSRKGAVGFWQFLADTGRKYGLIINKNIDERRNLFASTRAAICYFKALYQSVGSWTLAAAAYNMGEEGLQAEIIVQHTRDYYRLYLPLETQRFIFRILSVKLILLDPVKFGFNLNDDDYYPPLEFDRISIDCFQEIPLSLIASASRTNFKVLKDLNPEIRGHYLTEGTHTILISKGAKKGFNTRYKKLVKDYESDKTDRIYVIKEGDNLSSIAEKFDVPLAVLIIWNSIDLNKPIHPGDRLIIYSKDKKE